MHNSDVAISLQHLSKKYYRQKQKTFKELFHEMLGGNKTFDSFWAVKEIDLDIKKGETIGLVGKNGSGKSTLLKLIARVTNPTKGNIETEGRIVPLIELGAGFHHELTGRENIYLNGVILGLSRKEIATLFDKIVDFSGIREFIDDPVKHYSSGMFLRLAFAIAVNACPSILLIDEILAVGDAEFQEKCLEVITGFVNDKQTTVIIVSHDAKMVERFCSKAILMEHGEVKMIAEPKKVIVAYGE